ncbi:hypothetical protein O3P69_004521 [Scylla paramamosain]|uniref:Uncharacterized protein n=1 Tax=Scylla paramamosain TaxID=85552 RepID=A0AAW0UEX9_SCYPA
MFRTLSFRSLTSAITEVGGNVADSWRLVLHCAGIPLIVSQKRGSTLEETAVLEVSGNSALVTFITAGQLGLMGLVILQGSTNPDMPSTLSIGGAACYYETVSL